MNKITRGRTSNTETGKKANNLLMPQIAEESRDTKNSQTWHVHVNRRGLTQGCCRRRNILFASTLSFDSEAETEQKQFPNA